MITPIRCLTEKACSLQMIPYLLQRLLSMMMVSLRFGSRGYELRHGHHWNCQAKARNCCRQMLDNLASVSKNLCQMNAVTYCQSSVRNSAIGTGNNINLVLSLRRWDRDQSNLTHCSFFDLSNYSSCHSRLQLRQLKQETYLLYVLTSDLTQP